MAAVKGLNSSLITDYFPPSPVQEKKEEISDENGHPDLAGSTEADSDRLKADLSTSSLLLTPNPSPNKDEEKPDTLAADKLKEPHCKKALENKLNLVETEERQDSPRPKSRRRRGKKKQDVKKEEQTSAASSTGPAKPKSPRKKKTDQDGLRNTLVTDYFAVRRSSRKPKSEIEKEKAEDLVDKILNGCEDGLKVVDFENKGRGVVATKTFHRGEFVVEYAGDLISIPEANEREGKYAKDPSKGCYMYYFNFQNRKYCIDATAESGKLGRLLNHSKTKGNCHTRQLEIKAQPYLILVASREIKEGEELLYDYGDRSKDALDSNPWLKS